MKYVILFSIFSFSFITNCFSQSETNRIPHYSDINKTTERYSFEHRFTGVEFNNKYTWDNYFEAYECRTSDIGTCKERNYFESIATTIIDYNNDGKDDLLYFLINSTYYPDGHPDEAFISKPGKWVLINDYKNKTEKKYFESNHWWIIDMISHDFDGDGSDEVLVVNIDGHHSVPRWKEGTIEKFTILDIDSTGMLTKKRIDYEESYGFVDVGDIDNDGDIDIVLLQQLADLPTNPSLVVTLFNDGHANFTPDTTSFKENQFLLDIKHDISQTMIEIFDVNDDGCLDITWGQPKDDVDTTWVADFKIVLGNCDGTYSIEKSITIDDVFPDTPLEPHIHLEPYSVTYHDYDMDGDYDMIINHAVIMSHIAAAGNHVRILENNKMTFKDVSDSVFPENSFYDPNNIYGYDPKDDFMPFFTNISVYDSDNDGDFDLVPRNLSKYSVPYTNKHSTGLEYFEYKDGTFTLTAKDTTSSQISTSTESNTSPTSYSLNQNYPNPFNPTTTITYSLPQSGMVTLNVYDITGRFITTLVNGVKGVGTHTVQFEGSSLSSGMYIYTLETDGYRQTRQMMLVK